MNASTCIIASLLFCININDNSRRTTNVQYEHTLAGKVAALLPPPPTVFDDGKTILKRRRLLSFNR